MVSVAVFTCRKKRIATSLPYSMCEGKRQLQWIQTYPWVSEMCQQLSDCLPLNVGRTFIDFNNFNDLFRLVPSSDQHLSSALVYGRIINLQN